MYLLTREALHCLDNINPSPFGPPSSDMASQSWNSILGIYFADEEVDKYPSNLDDVKSAVFAVRGSPDPDEVDAKNFRKRIRRTCMGFPATLANGSDAHRRSMPIAGLATALIAS